MLVHDGTFELVKGLVGKICLRDIYSARNTRSVLFGGGGGPVATSKKLKLV